VSDQDIREQCDSQNIEEWVKEAQTLQGRDTFRETTEMNTLRSCDSRRQQEAVGYPAHRRISEKQTRLLKTEKALQDCKNMNLLEH
jgi:hypothetical protein